MVAKNPEKKDQAERYLWTKNRTQKSNMPIMSLRIGEIFNKFGDSLIATLKCNLIKTGQRKPKRSAYLEIIRKVNEPFEATFRQAVSIADLKEFLEYLELFAPITPKWHIDPKTKRPMDGPSNVHIFNSKLWNQYAGETPKPLTKRRLQYLRSKDK